MKFTILLSLLGTAAAFHAAPLSKQPRTPASQISMASPSKKKGGNPMGDLLRQVTNNFQPFHGHGSLENDLEEQWEAQQEILRSRRTHHLDKDHLKKKYSDPSKVKFDGKIGDSKVSEFGKNFEP